MTTDFIDHGTDVRDAVVIHVYKNGYWIPSKPWCADGSVWRSWQSFFRTRKALLQNAQAVAPNAEIRNGRP